MAIESMLEDAGQKGRMRKLIITIVLAVIVLHVLAAVVAGAFVVARYFLSPPAQFEVQKDIRLPAKERQHRMNMAEFDAMTPKPSFNDKMASIRPADFALPDLPQVPMDQMLPLDPSAIVADAVSSLVGTAGLGGGGLGAGGLGGTGEGFTFMGMEASGQRILLMYDISTTVVNAATRAGMPMDNILQETKRLLEGLGINTRFAMVQFARNYAFFNKEMLPATDQNRAAAVEWLDRWFVTEGSMKQNTPGMVRGSPGFIEVLREGFKMEPDVVFVISDGGFYGGSEGGGPIPYSDIDRALMDLQKALPGKANIYFIGFGMKPDNLRDMRRIIGRHGGAGRLREM